MSDTVTKPESATLRRAFLAIEDLKARLEAARSANSAPIAVVGIGCRFPGGASSPDAYWRMLCAGTDAIAEVPADRWNADALYDANPDAPGKTATRWGGFIDDVDSFDAAFFGISPREAIALDPQQRLLLEVAWEALEHAGIAPDRLGGSSTGVFVGMASSDYAQKLRAAGTAALDAYYASGVAHSMAAGRLSYVLGLTGPSLTLDTACSSSLVAVHLAVRSLRTGECDTALAGGVHLTLSPENTIAFSKAHMLARDGRCRTFDADASGFVEGEGCGIVVLKRLSDAIAAGDTILAVIRGSAVNQDGPSAGLTAPSGPAQEAVLRAALADAGVAPADVAYVEAHGTGTTLGDPIELRALAAALGEGRDATRRLTIGSVKTNIGHLEAAAGIAGLIKTVLALRHGEIPPHLHFRTPNPHVRWEELPLDVATTRRPFPPGRRIAGVSSFGFSGTNAHVVLEAAPPVERVTPPAPRASVLAVSAKTERARDALVDRILPALEQGEPFAGTCHTAAAGRAALEHRVAVVAADARTAQSRLAAWRAGETVAGVHVGAVPAAAAPPRIAMLFTGQGSQYAGMGHALYEADATFRAALDRCARVLDEKLDVPLPSLLWGEASNRLNDTRYTQPALFALEWALLELWRSFGVEPALVMGHSVGEFVAAAAAGVLDPEDALRLVCARARLMSELPRGGGMLAIAAAEDVVAEALAAGIDAGIAAINGPADTVIAGGDDALAQLDAHFRAAGIRTHRLAVSHAFHSRRMEPMLDAFERAAAGIAVHRPRVGIASNVTGALAAADYATPAYWRDHVRSPVRFAAGMRALATAGADVFIEIGPAPTLIGLGGRCIDDARALWLPSLRPERDEWETLRDAVARLWVRGAPLTPEAFAPRTARVSLPTYPWQRRRFWPAATPLESSLQQSGGHPLLGRRIVSPLAAAHFENVLRADAPAFLDDHRIDGRVVVPGVVLLELMRAAAVAHAGSAAALRDVTFTAPLVLEPEARVHTIVTTDGDGSATVRVHAQTGNDWTVHATGLVAHVRHTAATLPLEEARERCTEVLDRGAFDALLQAGGLALGDSFRCVERVWRRSGEAVAEIRLPTGVSADAELPIHPVLLDACIQTVAAAAPAGDGVLRVPAAADGFELTGRAAGTVLAHVTVKAAGGGLTADVHVHDESGTPIAHIAGLRLRPLRSAAVATGEAAPTIHDVAWQPAPLDPAGSVPENVLAEIERWVADESIARYETASAALDRLAADAIVAAFRQLGFTFAFGAELTENTLPVLPKYRRLVRRWCEILEEDGILARAADGWTVLRTPEPRAANVAMSDASWAGVADAEHALVTRCAPALADVLRGQRDPLELLFPGGSLELTEPLYHTSPMARASGALVRETLRDIAARAGRPLRVIEVGGGTAGTTAAVLPALADSIAEYLFTDISPHFVARAAERFGAHPAFRSGGLDLEANVPGDLAGSFDVVLAANVLHATADLRVTLERCASLLAPGGHLIAVEVTKPQRWVDVTFGLTDGWWRFTDSSVRASSPLLDVRGWTDVLQLAGFRYVSAAPDPADTRGILSQQAVLHAVRAAPGAYVVLGASGGLASSLADRLRREGDTVRLVTCGERCEASCLEDALRAAVAAGGKLRVVDLRALDIEDADAAVEAHLAAARAVSLLNTVAEHSPAGARVVMATRGAQQLPADGAPALAHTPLLGIARSARVERPELDCVVIDLDPHAAADPLAALLAELRTSTAETESAWRGGLRYVPRLTPLRTPSVRRDTARALVRGSDGALESLRLEPRPRRRPRRGEVEIRVHAAGLNFKDVLGALAAYEGEIAPLGSECAGTVVAVGDDVEGLAPGDEVVALAAGCHGDYVTTSARLVVRKPRALSFAQAAALPIPAVTATHALLEVGRLCRNERVLVHAAAGGVGLAAVRLAHRRGAEVFATAGSSAKRAFLRSIGVRHVFDSRTPEFGARIRALGGVDVVLNSLSGALIDASLHALREGGRFIEIGKRGIRTPEQIWTVRPDVPYGIVDWTDVARTRPETIRAHMQEALEAAANGSDALPPISTVPLHDAAAAYRRMAKAEHIGRIVLVNDAEASPSVSADATYLITGGLGGLGIETAKWLAAHGARSLVLLGRSAPAPAALAAIEQLRASGVTVRVEQADVADARAVQRIAASITYDMPPLRGVVHAAGALADGLLAEQDPARLRAAMKARVEGSLALHAAVRSQPLDFFLLFSSVAGLLGAPGQANHAAGTAYVGAFAHWLRAHGTRAFAIDWGAWSDVGAAADDETARRAQTRGLARMTPAAAFAALDRLLASDTPRAAVLAMDWAGFGAQPAADSASHVRDLVAATPATEAPQPVRAREASTGAVARRMRTSSPTQLRERLTAAPAAARHGIAREHVSRLAARVLGLDPGAVAPDRPLRELGIDSLMAVELRNLLRAELASDDVLPATLVFDHPTPDAIAHFLLDTLGLENGMAAESEKAAAPDAEDVIGRIEELSDEEVERLLGERMGSRVG